MIRRPPRSTRVRSSAASDVYKRQVLYGRGASDMKGAIACFAAAAMDYAKAKNREVEGTISLLITGDEEGPSVNGTKKVLKWMEQNSLKPDHCVVGEPSNSTKLGETIKIGRRGSLNGRLEVLGSQGHVACLLY